jgi:hypothetical protein
MSNTDTTVSLRPFVWHYLPHPWEGTQHCLRRHDTLGKGTCTNDHTGCIYNDGHNGCTAPSKLPIEGDFDSPLKKKNP